MLHFGIEFKTTINRRTCGALCFAAHPAIAEQQKRHQLSYYFQQSANFYA